MRRTIPTPSSTSSACKFGQDRRMSLAAPTPIIIWGQVPIGGLIGAPIGGPGPIGRRGAEKVRQLCSRIVQTFNVAQRVRLRPSLATASLNGLFEHPARLIFCHTHMVPTKFAGVSRALETATLELFPDHRSIQAISTTVSYLVHKPSP